MRISRFTLFSLALALAIIPAVFSPASHAQQSAQAETISRCGTAAPSVVEVDTATTANNQLVALAAGKRVYVCGAFLDNDTATTALQFIYGTGTACATDETDLTGPMTVATFTLNNSSASHFVTAEGTALCLELSTNTQVNGYVTYVQY